MAVGTPHRQLLTTETHLLEMLGHGAPMMEVLNELCKFIDSQSPGAISIFFLLNNDGVRLQPVAGPKVPKTWRDEIENVIEVGPYAGFCSAAGAQGRTLLAGDISSDPLFAVHREAALREGLEIVHFQPILSVEKQILGALALCYPHRRGRRKTDSEIIDRAIHLAAIAIQCHRSEEELREYSRRLSQSQDDERRRIARELHDSTGQKLSVLAMNLGKIENQAVSSGAAFYETLSECLSLTRGVSDEIRTLSYMMHPPLLDECGLDSAIQMYLGGINQRESLDVQLEMPRPLPRLSEEAELAIFRIVQASLTNIHLHSGSHKARVKLEQVREGVRVTISDHGRGIPHGVLGRTSSGKGLGVGIAGMRERLKQLGGRFEINTGEGGTQVIAVVPGCHFRKVKSATAAAEQH